MKLKKEFEFFLQDEITYSDGRGEAIKTKKLFLKAPSNKQTKYAFKLQQKFMQAMKSNMADMKNQAASNQSETKTDEKLNGDSIFTALLMSSIDISEFLEDLKMLLISGACLVDGKVELIEAWFDLIGFEDKGKLLGEYIASFLLPSIMK